jgi:hypothetical protein
MAESNESLHHRRESYFTAYWRRRIQSDNGLAPGKAVEKIRFEQPLGQN